MKATLLTEKSIVSGDGYVKFPDGTLMQQGNTQCILGYSKATVTYPIKFSVKPKIMITPSYDSEQKVFCSLGIVSVSSFDAYINGTDFGAEKARSFSWFAIGRWK